MPDSSRRQFDSRADRAPRLNIHDPGVPDDRESYYDGVGAELRAERIRNGLSLEEVSQRLRIRSAHLEAMEAGRFGDLPGRIYAIGFLRSYAEFLGADGDVCVNLFKAEVGPDGHSRKLIFPVPAEENRRPGWLTLAASVLLAAAVYAGWEAYRDTGGEIAQLVPEVPQRFLQSEPPEQRTSSLTAANASEPPAMEGDRIADDATVPETPVALAAVTETRQDEPALPTGAAADAAPAQDAAPPAAEAQDADPSPVAPADSLSPAPAEPRERELALAPPPPLPAAPRADGYVPRVLGIANRGSRVTVRAAAPAQIIVKSGEGATILPHRVLRAGDSYRAPLEGDAILQGEGIGGLEVFVDGVLIGRAGDLAAPADALSLNADYLKSLAR